MTWFSSFVLFGPLHLLVLIITVLSIILTIIIPRIYTKTLFASLLLAQIITFNSYHLIRDSFEVHRYLPFHVCTISAFLGVFGLLTENQKIRTLLLYWGFIPALLAIAFPDLSAGLFTFRFWEFFVSHIVIVLSSVWVMKERNTKLVSKKTLHDIIFSYITLFIFAVCVVIPANKLLGGNYMYLEYRAASGFAFIPEGMFYLPSLFTLPIPVFILTAAIAEGISNLKTFAKSYIADQKIQFLY